MKYMKIHKVILYNFYNKLSLTLVIFEQQLLIFFVEYISGTTKKLVVLVVTFLDLDLYDKEKVSGC